MARCWPSSSAKIYIIKKYRFSLNTPMKLAIKIFYKFIFDYLSLTVHVLYFCHLVIQTCLMGKIIIKNDLKSEKNVSLYIEGLLGRIC